MIEPSKPKAKRRGLIAVLIPLLGLWILIGGLAHAAQADSKKHKQAKRRIIAVALSKGATYTIGDVRKGSAPGIKVVSNPHALVVNTGAPGQIVLVGADTGSWNLDVTLASGEKVTYAVNVKAEAPPQGSLKPGSAPTVIP